MKTPSQWWQDHYPVSAESLKDASNVECLEHSIAKFSGLKCENLPEGWVYKDHYLFNEKGENQLAMDSESCTLCQKYWLDNCTNRSGEACPIKEFTGHTCCDYGTVPWQIYDLSQDDPTPMLELLSVVLRVEKDLES